MMRILYDIMGLELYIDSLWYLEILQTKCWHSITLLWFQVKIGIVMFSAYTYELTSCLVFNLKVHIKLIHWWKQYLTIWLAFLDWQILWHFFEYFIHSLQQDILMTVCFFVNIWVMSSNRKYSEDAKCLW